MAVGAAGRVRRADREYPDHQPDGGGPAQAVRRPAARAERRRRHHRGADCAAPGGAGACRPVPCGRAGAQIPGGRLPGGRRLADLAVEDAGAADPCTPSRSRCTSRSSTRCSSRGPGCCAPFLLDRRRSTGPRCSGATLPASSAWRSRRRRATWGRPGSARCATLTSSSCAPWTSMRHLRRAACWHRT